MADNSPHSPPAAARAFQEAEGYWWTDGPYDAPWLYFFASGLLLQYVRLTPVNDTFGTIRLHWRMSGPRRAEYVLISVAEDGALFVRERDPVPAGSFSLEVSGAQMLLTDEVAGLQQPRQHTFQRAAEDTLPQGLRERVEEDMQRPLRFEWPAV